MAVASQIIDAENPLRPFVDRVLKKCPLALNERHSSPNQDENSFTINQIVDLHARIMRATYLNKRENAKLTLMQNEAFKCQDVLAASNNLERMLSSPFILQKPVLLSNINSAQWESLMWLIYVKGIPIIMKILSILCACLSVVLVWSESLFQIPGVTLSIPQLIFKSENLSYFNTELLSFIVVCYMCICTYWTLMGIKVFDLYQMIPNRNTDENTLLFVGAYLCKLTFPIIYNFLNMAGLADAAGQPDGKIDYSAKPVFIQYLGTVVNLTPLFGTGYTCTLILLNLHVKLLGLFNMSNYLYQSLDDQQDSSEGRQILEQGPCF